MTTRCDTSLLPECALQFCVVSDTHNMLDPGGRALEFESRRRQTARVTGALRRVAACDPAFVLHLGDLVQSFPGSADFDRNVDAACAQLRECGIEPLHVVAGNHDVGDKPDATMPAPAVDATSLAGHEARFGRSWYSVEYVIPGQRAPLAVLVLNSQILNTGLEAEHRQRRWLEEELPGRRRQGARLVVALHLPPFVTAPTEPGLGHYDNVAEPARAWLLGLLRRHPVELVLAGHVHWAFSGRLHDSAYVVAPSTSFTRPGFGHLFADGPAPERGRDDSPKLGFLLCRVFADRIDIHTVRTGGVEAKAGAVNAVPGDTAQGNRAAHLLTPLPTAARHCGLGVTLTHPLSWVAQVPLAWPSAVREPARNDYPLLACRELGIVAARAPLADLTDAGQANALEELRREGVALQAVELWEGEASISRLEALAGEVDGLEVQLAGKHLPDAACTTALAHYAGKVGLSLCPVLPGQKIPGKQHPRTRTGYAVGELADLAARLETAGLDLDSALCRIEPGLPPWPQVEALRQTPASPRIARLDLLLALPSANNNQSDEMADARWLAEALFAARLLHAPRTYVEPLIDLDRTMDIGLGLLDGRCNPRPVMAVARCLNAILFREEAAWDPIAPGQGDVPADGPPAAVRTLASPDGARRAVLWIPAPGDADQLPSAVADLAEASPMKVYDLIEATSTVVMQKDLATVTVAGPALVVS